VLRTVALVQGQVLLLQVLGLLLMEALVQVLRPEVVKEVFVVRLSSLSPTPTQTTHPPPRPAARVWAWGAKGSGFPIVRPAQSGNCALFLSQHAGSAVQIRQLEGSRGEISAQDSLGQDVCLRAGSSTGHAGSARPLPAPLLQVLSCTPSRHSQRALSM
jgi:hypothetical protein